jgi:hypothetical protein
MKNTNFQKSLENVTANPVERGKKYASIKCVCGADAKMYDDELPWTPAHGQLAIIITGYQIRCDDGHYFRISDTMISITKWPFDENESLEMLNNAHTENKTLMLDWPRTPFPSYLVN